MHSHRKYCAWLMGGAAALALSTAAAAQTRAEYNIPPQPLSSALKEFGLQSGYAVLATPAQAQAKISQGVMGAENAEAALARVLAGTGLSFRREGDVFMIVQAGEGGSGPQAGSAVEALIVTAQKREEDIQDVPIAISAFSQEDLTRSQVAGGPDLITQVPNMTFTKTNFSSYSIQIRGIGTQAISATTDPAVAVAFNNTPFIRNRFFEQEFYDLERVEVLRGPQGTLYGRNATGGVVNIISAKPKFYYEAKASADIGNYSSSRVEGMVNIPLVEDMVALRLAGAWTKRDGYAVNALEGGSIDGRDLWSSRLSLRVSPNDRFDANLIWEHFEEDDDRLRSGKQLCKKDVVFEVAGFAVDSYYMSIPDQGQSSILSGPQASFSQGCKRNSLYAEDSFQRPNGLMLPYYRPLGSIGLPQARNDPYAEFTSSSDPVVIDTTNDQPEDLRVIESMIAPRYRALNDLAELQLSFDLTDSLTLTSETAYANDTVYSLQDFNRFNTAPGAWGGSSSAIPDYIARGILREDLGPNLTFCDPQLGCSDRLVAVDISTAESTQFSQELRLSSDFEGAFNFSLGANFLRGDSEDKYYVFINSLSLIAAINGDTGSDPLIPYVANETDNSHCLINGFAPGDPNGIYPVTQCVYIDPNPIDQVNDKGHNYFLSKNPYKLISYAAFGEAYYQATDTLKLTLGLRWTVDKKEAPRVPTWILGSQSYGYPVAETIEQEWREPTGRLTVDWKPDLAFTDQTLLYASLAHGYKAGGANPPGFVRVFYSNPDVADQNTAASATRPRTFDPEFVDALEIGTKNTLADGRVTMNLAAFYYDYKDYQISEIVDRSAFNRNFDATVWGVELEADWRPLENLRFGFKGGYQNTRIADGEEAVDLMDRTAGDSRWVLVRPFPTFASSCIAPAWLFVGNSSNTPANPELVNAGGLSGGNPGVCEEAYLQGYDPVTGQTYQANPPTSAIAHPYTGIINYTAWSDDPDDYVGLTWPGDVVTDRRYPGWDPTTAPNGGEGIAKPLGGNQLPNAPNWTATITADYTVPLPNEWLATLHTDLHWQGESWWRVFNDHEYGKLDEYFTMNLAAIFTNEEAGWNIMAYIKNVTDETAITGAFLNSDDTGLTTNVFLTEPRLYGLRVTKAWDGGPLLGSFGERRDGPYPFTVEIGGQIQRHEAPNRVFEPAFASVFPASLDIFGDAQRQDLDWGDGRDVTLTYRPGGPWRVSAGVRYGRTNTHGDMARLDPTDPACGFGGIYEPYCELLKDDVLYGRFTRVSKDDWAGDVATDRERHEIVDFSVGRDMGVGVLSRSTISLSLRWARFQSDTLAESHGTPDWDIPAGFLSPYPGFNSTHTVYDARMSADREFKGAGPVISWEASLPLNASDAGAIALDWTVSGGVLFGERRTTVSTAEQGAFFELDPFETVLLRRLGDVGTPISFTSQDFSRSDDANSTMAGASLGLSYSVGGFKAGAGYRWERYFDVIDGGIANAHDEDRTIDGPYFKIAVGFGG